MNMIKSKALKDLFIVENTLLFAFGWMPRGNLWAPPINYPVVHNMKGKDYTRSHAINSLKWWLDRGWKPKD